MTNVCVRISDAGATASLNGLLRALGWQVAVVDAAELRVPLTSEDGPALDAELARLRLAVVSWQVARPTVLASIVELPAGPPVTTG
ncbi:MAG: hypothetical protein R3C15_17145 [Thermoleophilia bacterium]